MNKFKVGHIVKISRPNLDHLGYEGRVGFVDSLIRTSGDLRISVGGIAGGHVDGSRGFIVFHPEELDHA